MWDCWKGDTMVKTRAGFIGLWLGVIGLLGAAAWGAQLKVREAVLYVSAPAEIVASVTPAGPNASFDLPKTLVANSLQASQGGAGLSVVVQPVYAPAKGNRRRELLRYHARVPGAHAGKPGELHFHATDLAWTPAMSLQFAAGKARLQVQVSLTNKALDLTGAKLRLMSGHVAAEREMPGRFSGFSGYEWYEDVMADYGRDAGEQGWGALHAVTELTASDLPIGSIRQIPLLSADVAASRTYRWDTHPRQREAGAPEVQRPEQTYAIYSFPNTTGHALPEGKVTVSEGSTAVGDGYLAWTPSGEAAVIAVASVRNLMVRRKEDKRAPAPVLGDAA